MGLRKALTLPGRPLEILVGSGRSVKEGRIYRDGWMYKKRGCAGLSALSVSLMKGGQP